MGNIYVVDLEIEERFMRNNYINEVFFVMIRNNNFVKVKILINVRNNCYIGVIIIRIYGIFCYYYCVVGLNSCCFIRGNFKVFMFVFS